MQHADNADPDLCRQMALPDQPKAERIATIDVVALDWNCPKYIPQMISAAKVNAFVESQLKQLTEENEALKAQLRKLQNQ